MIKGVLLERKSLKNTFKLMVKLFWGSGELHVVKHTFGPNRPAFVPIVFSWSKFQVKFRGGTTYESLIT
jgi:hypothetical protein